MAINRFHIVNLFHISRPRSKQVRHSLIAYRTFVDLEPTGRSKLTLVWITMNECNFRILYTYVIYKYNRAILLPVMYIVLMLSYKYLACPPGSHIPNVRHYLLLNINGQSSPKFVKTKPLSFIYLYPSFLCSSPLQNSIRKSINSIQMFKKIATYRRSQRRTILEVITSGTKYARAFGLQIVCKLLQMRVSLKNIPCKIVIQFSFWQK